MNKKIIFRLLLGMLCFVLSVSSYAQASKGLKYLSKNKYEEAAQAFTAAMNKPGEVPMAYYGFSKLYASATYKGYNIDTAYVNVLRAEKTFRKLDYKLKGKLSKKMTLADIRKEKKEIANLAFTKYEETNTVEGWDYFLDNYKKPGYKIEKKAKIERNKLAYEAAKKVGTYEAYGEVLKKYRKSLASKSPAILKKVEWDLLELYMKENSWENFEQFSAEYPYHSFVKDSVYYQLTYLDEDNDIDGMFALLAKYKKSSFSNVIADYLAASLPTNGSVEQCEQFVMLFPDHPDGVPVWTRFYKLYRKKNPRFQDIIAFEKKYPKNPISDIIKEDKMHFADKRFEIVMEKADPRAYKDFIKKFPDYPKVKQIEDLYYGQILENFEGELLSRFISFEAENPSVVKQPKWAGMKQKALDQYFERIGEVEDRNEILEAIKKYPSHKGVKSAWEAFYSRYKEEVGDDEETLDKFLSHHPDFPYPELIVQDKKKITNDAIDMAIENGTWRDCMDMANEHSTHAKVRTLWRTGVDRLMESNPTVLQLKKAQNKYPNCPFMSEIEKKIQEERVDYFKKAKDDVKMRPKSRKGLWGLVNTSYSEYLPVMTTDGQRLYFCRKTNNEDIYVSEMKNGQWQEAVPIFELNNLSYTNVAPLTLSSDGNKMLIFVDGSISETHKTAAGWAPPKKLPDTFNTASWQADAIYSADGKVIIFTRQTFLSDMNLYISHLQKDGTWSHATKLPAPINTDSDERSAFLHPDMRTLYFSSERPGGFGSLDVYVSTRIGEGWDKWTEPENLGEAVNSSKTDWGFKVTTDGATGYFNKQSTGESDFYSIPLKEEFQAAKITSISGFVKNRQGAGIGAEIVWTQLETGKEVQITSSDPTDGSFYATLPDKGMYGYTIEKKGYFPLSGNIEVKEESMNFVLDQELVLVTIVESKKENLSLPLNNLFFDTGKYIIKKASFPDLNRLKDWITENNLSITIIGHTDNVGDNQANLVLSQNRARAVKDYLEAHGADASKIFTEGKGENSPVATNETEKGRHANRRVEIKIK